MGHTSIDSNHFSCRGHCQLTWKNQDATRGGNILVSANRSIHKKMLKLLKPVL